jgi:hypothetical protein
MNWVESTDRSSSDYLRFGLGFLAFLIGAAGMETNCVWVAAVGAAVFLFTIVSYLGAED